MDKVKWQGPEIPIGVLVAKLSEECGEVANHYADAFFTSMDDKDSNERHAREMLTEARHVKHIADQIITRLHAVGGKVFTREWD